MDEPRIEGNPVTLHVCVEAVVGVIFEAVVGVISTATDLHTLNNPDDRKNISIAATLYV